MSRKQTLEIDYTNKDYEAFRTMLIQKLHEKLPEYTDTSQTDAGIVILECLANGLDICSMYNDIVANDCFLHTTQDRQIATLIARQLGYTAKNQTASVYSQVFVLNSILMRDIVIPKGTVVGTEESQDSAVVYFETTEDLVIPSGNLGNEQNEDGSYKFSVKVVQGTTVTEDLLGSSNGLAYQSFKLNYPQVLTDSIELLVNEGKVFKVWKQVDNFIDSDSESKHFTVRVDEFDNCYIEFGSGRKGKIPAVCPNGIIASYRIGGGTIGNVKANTITKVYDSIAYVESTFNPYSPSTYGHEKETIEEIRENAPAKFRTQDRAITAQDYADLLRVNFYEILSAVGIPDSVNKLKMNVYYQMREGYEMTPDLLNEINTFFESRVIPCTTFSLIQGENYVVNISANLIVEDGYSRSAVTSLIENYIKDTYFSYENFVFGDMIEETQLEYGVRSSFEGIRSFRITSPNSDIISPQEDYQIIKLGTLSINASGGNA